MSGHSPAPLAAPHAPFERWLVARRLERAARQGAATFLVERVTGDLLDRLRVVLRTFTAALDLGTPAPHLADALAAEANVRALVRAALVPGQPSRGWQGVGADEEALPFAAESFDLVVSALALHAVNDLPGTFAQVRRALRPDGLFLACLAGGATLNELRHALAAAEAEIKGGASPRVAPFADVRDLGALLQRAGFALPVVDAEPLVVRYDTAFALMRDLRAMGAANLLADRARTFLRRDVLLRAADIYAERFADPDGRVRATFDILWVSGWAPHASQQKPLKPGSAKASLAEALAPRRPGG